MYFLRKSKDRGHANHGWLDSRHTFSFSDYFDSSYMGFRVLRVINEDRIDPGAGFPTHPHRDMEILSYVIEGALEHRDTLGNAAVVRPGEVQRMSAGTGIVHSEMNHSKTSPAHFLQIWILPEAPGLAPGYSQVSFEPKLKDRSLALAASRDGREGSVSLNQDVDIHVGKPKAGEILRYELRPGRHAWIQMVRGKMSVGGYDVESGDGLAVSEETLVEARVSSDAEFLLFDLP